MRKLSLDRSTVAEIGALSSNRIQPACHMVDVTRPQEQIQRPPSSAQCGNSPPMLDERRHESGDQFTSVRHQNRIFPSRSRAWPRDPFGKKSTPTRGSWTPTNLSRRRRSLGGWRINTTFVLRPPSNHAALAQTKSFRRKRFPNTVLISF